MPARGSMFRTTDRFSASVRVLPLLVIGICGAAAASEGRWPVPPANSVLVESSAAAVGLPNRTIEGVPGTIPPDGSAVTIGEDGAVVGSSRFGGVAPTTSRGEYPPIGMEGCGAGGCTSGCTSCNGDGCGQDDPLGCLRKKDGGCWIGRADALLLWRNAPPDRPLVDNGLVAGTLLNANGLDSTPAAGPRFSIFRANNCTGHAIEATYLRAANFRSIRPLSTVSVPYELAAPGLYGNTGQIFDNGNANLGSRVQSFELNSHRSHGQHIRFLAGFRWIEWQEQFTLQGDTLGGVSDFYQTNCFNDLYGGQIGLDANIMALPWVRFDSVVKAGVYYNNAVQSSQYTTNDPLNPGTASVAIGQSPASGAFAGEVGVTGVIPITSCLDIRLGYFGLWLSGIAQPTQQLAGQQLTPGQPAVGSLTTNGSVVLQGVSLGLEGRW